MQVILTEEEYLKLKGRSEDDKKTYVKRIDVALALEELIKELANSSCDAYNPVTFQPLKREEYWKKHIDRFLERIG